MALFPPGKGGGEEVEPVRCGESSAVGGFSAAGIAISGQQLSLYPILALTEKYCIKTNIATFGYYGRS
ncbi:hypothetical protein [Nostoc sp.]|uniref:hypothetical protein n=1 Tax=Nostoc sp. TaxID=1180 RepID=UPI002FFAD2A4